MGTCARDFGHKMSRFWKLDEKRCGIDWEKRDPIDSTPFFSNLDFFDDFLDPEGGKTEFFEISSKIVKFVVNSIFLKKFVFGHPPREGGGLPPPGGVHGEFSCDHATPHATLQLPLRNSDRLLKFFQSTLGDPETDIDELPMSMAARGDWGEFLIFFLKTVVRRMLARPGVVRGQGRAVGPSAVWWVVRQHENFFSQTSFKVFKVVLVGRQHPSTPELGFRKVRDLIDTTRCIIDPRSELFRRRSWHPKKFSEKLFEFKIFLCHSWMSSSVVDKKFDHQWQKVEKHRFYPYSLSRLLRAKAEGCFS
jgi:hypothetical protein